MTSKKKKKNLSGHTVDDNFNCATPPLPPLSGPRLHSSPLLGLIVLVVVCRGNPVRGQNTRKRERENSNRKTETTRHRTKSGNDKFSGTEISNGKSDRDTQLRQAAGGKERITF